MFKISYDKKITMVQGDTGVIRMRIHNYELLQGDEVRFAIVNKANPSILLCQHSDKKIVLEKQVTVFEKDGSARIIIYPYDTEYLQPGKYLYEIQVKTKDGRIDTVVPLTSFTLMDGSIQGEYGQTTPSKPEPTPSEIELRFKRLENEIIPELGNRITNVEKDIDSISSSLDNKASIINSKNTLNVKKFGAKGDGTTDDTIAIKKAIESNYCNLYFPTGVYLISEPLNFTHKNVYGDSDSLQNNFKYEWEKNKLNNTVFYFDIEDSEKAITFYSHNNHFKNIIIKNINQTKTNTGIYVYGDMSTLSNLYIIGFRDIGLEVGTAYFSKFDNIQIVEDREPCNIGLKTWSQTDGMQSTACTFNQIMIRSKFNKNYSIGGCNHIFFNIFTRNSLGNYKLYFENCKNTRILSCYMEQDIDRLTDKNLFIEENCYSVDIDNIYYSGALVNSQFVNNGVACSYNANPLSVDFGGFTKKRGTSNYLSLKSFYYDTNLKSYDTDLTFYNNLSGNITINTNNIIISKTSENNVTTINFNVNKQFLFGKTVVFVVDYTTDSTSLQRIRFGGSYGNGYNSGIMSVCDIINSSNKNFQIIPDLNVGETFTINSIGLYIIEDNIGHDEPFISKNGDYCYGDLVFRNGRIGLKDISTGNIRYLTINNGVLTIV